MSQLRVHGPCHWLPADTGALLGPPTCAGGACGPAMEAAWRRSQAARLAAAPRAGARARAAPGRRAARRIRRRVARATPSATCGARPPLACRPLWAAAGLQAGPALAAVPCAHAPPDACRGGSSEGPVLDRCISTWEQTVKGVGAAYLSTGSAQSRRCRRRTTSGGAPRTRRARRPRRRRRPRPRRARPRAARPRTRRPRAGWARSRSTRPATPARRPPSTSRCAQH